MNNKAALLARDQYHIILFLRQLASMIRTCCLGVVGPIEAQIEVPLIDGIDDIFELRVDDSGAKKKYFSQVKKQSTPLEEKHLTKILEGIKRNPEISARLLISDFVSVDYNDEQIELRVVREVCSSAAAPGADWDRFFASLNGPQKKFIQYVDSKLNLGTNSEAIFNIISRLEVEITGPSDHIYESICTKLGELFAKPEVVVDQIYSFILRNVDKPIRYTFPLLYKEVLEGKHLFKKYRKFCSIDVRDGKVFVESTFPLRDLLKVSWGNDQSIEPSIEGELDLEFKNRFLTFAKISTSLVRMNVHGSKSKMIVVNVNEWREYAKVGCAACFGVEHHAYPWLEHGTNSKFVEYSEESVRPFRAFLEEIKKEDFEENFEELMDTWVWGHLKYLVKEELFHENSQLGLVIESNLRTEMYEMWQSWEKALDDSSNLRRHFLSSNVTLLFEDSDKNFNKFFRLGPITTKACHLNSVVFALAIVTTLTSGELIEDVNQGNLMFGDANKLVSHLIGLKWSSRRQIVLETARIINSEKHLPLMAYGEYGTESSQTEKSIKTINSVRQCFKGLPPLNTLTIPFDGQVKLKMSEGKTALKQLLVMRFFAEIESQKKQAETATG